MGIKIKSNRLKEKPVSTFGVKKPFAGKDKNRSGSKKECVKSERIKKKYSAKNKKLITAEDKKYLEWLQFQSFCCFVCGVGSGIEMHHVKKHSVDKKDHTKLIPLCIEHHRLGSVLSAHGTPVKFMASYSFGLQCEAASVIYKDYLKESVL
jgi:hypothetical protein